MILPSAIVCDRDRRIADDRRSSFHMIADDRRPYCDLRSAITWKPFLKVPMKLVFSVYFCSLLNPKNENNIHFQKGTRGMGFLAAHIYFLTVYIYYIINSYRYLCIVNCIVTEKPHQGSVNKVLYCIVWYS